VRGGGGGRKGREGGEGGGCGAGGGAHVRACTRRLTCPLLPNANWPRQMDLTTCPHLGAQMATGRHYQSGFDKQGRRMYWMRGDLDAKLCAETWGQKLEHLVFLLERPCRVMEERAAQGVSQDEQWIWVSDFTGFGLAWCSPRRTQLTIRMHCLYPLCKVRP
jgi:hypothetical protein